MSIGTFLFLDFCIRVDLLLVRYKTVSEENVKS